MRTISAVAVTLALAGCGDYNPIDNVKTQIETRQEVPKITEAIEATRAVQAYQAKHGENPASIEALEQSEGKLKKAPPGMRYSYDPESGKIELVEAK
jgi:hypothetical protein